MIGSIIGDIVGSIYEFSNIRTKDFEFFARYVEYTDDSILTLATAAFHWWRITMSGMRKLIPLRWEDMETVSRIGSSRRQEPDMLRHTTAAATDRPCV